MGVAMITQLVERARTVRRFMEERQLDEAFLHAMIDLARLGGSARNAQVLKYALVTDEKQCQLLFPMLGWAGYLSDWPGPEPGERPAAYILCLLDTQLLKGKESEAHFDLGIATQNILLGAAEQGVYGCRIASFSPKIHDLFQINEQYEVLLVLALGYPAEEVVIDELGPGGDIKYWRDDNGVHHVPKRSLSEIIVSLSAPTER